MAHELPDEKEKTVHVLHVGDVENANFKFTLDGTLQALWDKAYAELGIAKRDRDTFQAVEGGGRNKQSTDLMPHLQLTLAQAVANGLTKTLHFEIVAETGGA